VYEVTGRGKRSVKRDFNFYDPPEKVRAYIEAPGAYRRGAWRLELRDRALMSLLYIGGARAVEVVGGYTLAGYFPGLSTENFVDQGEFIMLRGLKAVKYKFTKIGAKWVPIKNWKLYPNRPEIPIPREGPLAWIGHHVENWLDVVGEGPLFKIGPNRAYHIVHDKTGLMPHYFRAMGLKLWYRLFGKDAFRLKEFSGHKDWNSLAVYMADIDRAKENLLNYGGGHE